MINYEKDDFDNDLEDIMESLNKILNNTGEGFETDEEENESKLKFNREEKNL